MKTKLTALLTLCVIAVLAAAPFSSFAASRNVGITNKLALKKHHRHHHHRRHHHMAHHMMPKHK